MKIFRLIVLVSAILLVTCEKNPAGQNETSTFTDSRDNQGYNSVKIGEQVWMSENLNYLPAVSPSTEVSETDPYYYVFQYEGNNVSAAKRENNYQTYGVLYNWEAAMKACPSGWHLPSDDEWKVLELYLGMSQKDADSDGPRESGLVGFALKSSKKWESGGSGNNSSDFNALPGGFFSSSSANRFEGIGSNAFFTTSTFSSTELVRYRSLSTGSEVQRGQLGLSDGLSVRCVKGSAIPVASFSINPAIGSISTIFQFDASGSTDAETATNDLEVRWDWNGDGTWDTDYNKLKTNSHQYAAAGNFPVILEVRDGDGIADTLAKTVSVIADGTLTDSRTGHVYAFKTIGTQTWMMQNLDYLPSVSPSSAGSDTDPYYYVYDYQGSNVQDAKATENYTTYGVLYNWTAAKTACPSGWHLPDLEEWKTLITYLGGEDAAGGKVKEKGTRHWQSPNTGATNESDFTALPGGNRFGNIFNADGIQGYFWMDEAKSALLAWQSWVSYDNTGLRHGNFSKSLGVSVRCLRD